MVTMLAYSAIDCGFEPQSGQTKDYKSIENIKQTCKDHNQMVFYLGSMGLFFQSMGLLYYNMDLVYRDRHMVVYHICPRLVKVESVYLPKGPKVNNSKLKF